MFGIGNLNHKIPTLKETYYLVLVFLKLLNPYSLGYSPKQN